MGVAAVALALAAAGVGLAVAAIWQRSPSPGPAEQGTAIQNGKLAFHAGGVGHGISEVAADGLGLTEITDPPGGQLDSFPAWSPDGKRIAFRRGSGDHTLFVANADGTGAKPLAEGFSVEPPAWSPDGTRIAFTGYRGEEGATYVVDPDGSNIDMVTDRGGGWLSWSPDGSRIAFGGAGDGGGADIFTVSADGSGLVRLTGSEGFDEHPVWSPDGRWIAFLSDREGERELYVVAPDGTGERRLTHFPTNDLDGYSPTWSPDGSTLALEVHEGGNWDLYLVGVDDGRSVRLTDDPGDENSPVWSPDGEWVAYNGSPSSEGDNTGTLDVYIVRPDGTDRTRLTEGAGVATGGLAWQAMIVADEGPSPSPSPLIDVSIVEIGHGGGIDVAVGEGGVWVSTIDGVVRIDPATGRVADIALGEPPFECGFDLAVGSGSVWATRGCEGGTEVVRIDPGTNQVVARVPLEQAYCVDVGEGAVWATASGAGLVVRIDPVSNEVVETIPVDPGSGPGGIGCLAVGAGGVWVTRGGGRDSLVRIDPASNQVVATVDIPNPDYWNEVVVEGGMVWVAIGGPDIVWEDGTKTNVVRVVRIDPMTNQVVGEPIEVGYGMFGIGSGNGSVWAYDGFSDAITQIDAESGAVVRVIPVIDGGSSWGGDPGIDAADGVVWMAGTRALNRIDLSNN